jgi:hypothetical protein
VITSLRFRREPSGICGGRLVRELQFEPVTDLQLSTVCHAANSARERLSRLLGRELTIDVFAPVLLQKDTAPVIFGNGLYYIADGTLCEAYVVFRERDGHRLAATAFGEDEASDAGSFSALEERALERIADEVLALCVPFCGDVRARRRGEVETGPPGCVTYFELRVAAPTDAVIGIGLARDPGPAFGAFIDRALLGRVALDVRAEFAEALVDARAVARWNVGTTVVLDTKIGAPTTLKVGNVVIARGDCGIRAQSNAVAITSTPFAEVR